MAIQFTIALLPLLLFFTSIHIVQSADFDITKFGAKADGKTDTSQALLKAWKEACGSIAPSSVVIPKGTYALGLTTFDGPCKAPMSIVLHGTITASQDPNAFKDGNWILIQRVLNLTLSGSGVIDGQGATAWGKKDNKGVLPINLRFFDVNNSLIEGLTSKDSKHFHVNVLGCHNMTFRKFSAIAPRDSPNTNGIHIGRSNGVYILDSKFETGNDCVSMGDGSRNVYVTGITCGPGHGISIGSLGKYKNEEPVYGIFVKKCTISNTLAGVRIKTWPALFPGSATDLLFEDITMNNVTEPINIDQEYCPWNQCNKKIPSRVRLNKISFKNIKGTSATYEAVKLICSKGIPCEDLQLANIDLTYKGPQGPTISLCANVNPKFSGIMKPPACTSKPKP